MKKTIFICLLAVLTTTFIHAQTQKGNFLIETGITFGSSEFKTELGLESFNHGSKSFNIGANVGYFTSNNFAIKGGLGYGSNHNKSNKDVWSYKLGLEYFIKGVVPVEVSINGFSTTRSGLPISYLTYQAGYAFFIHKKFLLKPFARYDLSLSQYYENTYGVGVVFGYSL